MFKSGEEGAGREECSGLFAPVGLGEGEGSDPNLWRDLGMDQLRGVRGSGRVGMVEERGGAVYVDRAQILIGGDGVSTRGFYLKGVALWPSYRA